MWAWGLEFNLENLRKLEHAVQTTWNPNIGEPEISRSLECDGLSPGRESVSENKVKEEQILEVDFRSSHMHIHEHTHRWTQIHMQMQNKSENKFCVWLSTQQYLTFNSNVKKCEILYCLCYCCPYVSYN